MNEDALYENIMMQLREIQHEIKLLQHQIVALGGVICANCVLSGDEK